VQVAGNSFVPLQPDDDAMAKVIRCQCGFLAHGETVDDAADAIESHLRADHPELDGRVRREDLLAMVEEA
jgi:hypothetical protein